MIKKTIKYRDYDGNNREEDFYFDLSEAEIAEMDFTIEGGLKKRVDNIIKAQDKPSLIKTFKSIILDAYGEKSPDGRMFLKEDENGRKLSNKFKQTPAYSILFMELATNDKSAAEFINGIIPVVENENGDRLNVIDLPSTN